MIFFGLRVPLVLGLLFLIPLSFGLAQGVSGEGCPGGFHPDNGDNGWKSCELYHLEQIEALSLEATQKQNVPGVSLREIIQFSDFMTQAQLRATATKCIHKMLRYYRRIGVTESGLYTRDDSGGLAIQKILLFTGFPSGGELRHELTEDGILRLDFRGNEMCDSVSSGNRTNLREDRPQGTQDLVYVVDQLLKSAGAPQ